MAITAKFLADFDAFTASVQGAEGSLKRLEGQGTQLGTSFDKVASKLVNALGVAFTVDTVIDFGRNILETGDRIQKMADQTSLSTDEVQRLMFIAGQSGSSLESLIGAVQNLQQRLGSGDAGAIGALKRLNINLGDLSKQSPYEQVTQLAGAIGAIEDPTTQATVAAGIFGKSWKEILPAIKSGMKDLGDQAPVMADATVKAIDRIGDAMTRAKGQSVVWGAGMIQSIEGVGFAVGNLLGIFDPAHFGRTHTQFLALQHRLSDPDGVTAAMTAAGDAAKNLMPRMAAIVPPGIPENLKEIEEGLTETAKALIEANKAVQEVEDSRSLHSMDWITKLSEAERISNKARMDEDVAANDTIAAAHAALNDFIAKESLDSLEYQVGNIWQRATEEMKAFKGSEAQRETYNRAVIALAWEQEQALRVAADAAASASEDASRRTVAANVAATNSFWAEVDAAAALAGIPSIGHRAPSLTDPGFASPTITGGGLHPLSGLHPLRAAGGPVTAGKGYVVGERGPEIFVPGQSGAILPNGGGSVTNVVIYVNGTAAEVAGKVADEFTRRMKSSTKVKVTQ